MVFPSVDDVESEVLGSVAALRGFLVLSLVTLLIVLRDQDAILPSAETVVPNSHYYVLRAEATFLRRRPVHRPGSLTRPWLALLCSDFLRVGSQAPLNLILIGHSTVTMPTSEEILSEKPPEYYQLLAECIKVAEHRGTIYYEDAGEPIDVIPLNMNHWTAALSKEMARHGEPMLSAVVVGQGDDTPGDGFYTLAHDIGPLEKDPSRMSDAAKWEFWESELERVYETFSK